MGAIVWNIVTWVVRHSVQFSSHALIGGLVGAGVAQGRRRRHRLVRALQDGGGHRAVAVLGFVLALLLVLVGVLDLRPPDAVRGRQHVPHPAVRLRLALLARAWRQRRAEDDGHHRRAALFAGHARAASSMSRFWVVLSCQAAMALGTLFGGWRIVHTMGSKITRLNPMQGFCAETGGAIDPVRATWLGIPVSTTHTITGAIIGVGAARRVSAVRWGLAGNIVVAWIVTMPAAAVIAATVYWLSAFFA